MIRILSIGVIAVYAMTSTMNDAHAEPKGFFEKLFSSSETETPKGPPPEKTLQAPFPTSSEEIKSNSPLMSIYDEKDNLSVEISNLAKPHRNEKQIIEWATEIVSQAMTINLKTYDTDFKKISPFFTDFAHQEYKAYLEKTNMMNVLTSNGMRLQAISDEEGSVIKAGEISGTYHWLIQVPLMASFYREDVTNVDKTSDFKNQKLLVKIQVGRIKPIKNGDIGLIVERWGISSYSK